MYILPHSSSEYEYKQDGLGLFITGQLLLMSPQRHVDDIRLLNDRFKTEPVVHFKYSISYPSRIVFKEPFD